MDGVKGLCIGRWVGIGRVVLWEIGIERELEFEDGIVGIPSMRA